MIERDFTAKAPTAAQIAARTADGTYTSRFELLRDAIRYLYWAHRYFLTLYALRPCRWEDVPADDPDARVPSVGVLDAGQNTAGVVEAAFAGLPPAGPGDGEQIVLETIAEPLQSIVFDPGLLSAVLPTLEHSVSNPGGFVIRVGSPRQVRSQMRRQEVLELSDRVPELTALLRQASAIASQHIGRWGRPDTRTIGELRATDFVLLAWPRSESLAQLLTADRGTRQPTARARRRPLRSGDQTTRLRYTPSRGVRIAGLSAVKGEMSATNDDIVANAAWHWSPMSSDDIFQRTGILERCYTERTLDRIAADASLEVLARADNGAAEIGAVVACSATNTQLMPSFAARIADLSGLTQLVGVWDVTAACAGFPYGLAQAAGIIEQAGCAVLLVLADKYSDKLGTVRSSRMLFGDGAAALLLTPATDGHGDIHVVQTYAGGSPSEVHAVVWPNGAFNNDVTVDAQGARSIVQRYMRKIVDDLAAVDVRPAAPPPSAGSLIPR